MTDVTEITGKLGTTKAKGAPNVFGREIWFRGSDDLLWLMDISKAPQPSMYDKDGKPISPPPKPVPAPVPTVVNPQGLKTLSTPQPCDDGYVYFQGEGNKLVMMERRFPHLYTIIDGVECWAAPAAPNDGFVYCRTGAGKLVRISVTRADFGTTTSYNTSCAFAPAVYIAQSRAYAFVSDADDGYKLKRVNLDQTSSLDIDTLSYVVHSEPFMGSNNKLYITTSGHDGYEVDPVDMSGTKIASDVESAPTVSELGDDGKVYWQTIGDKLLMASRDDTAKTTDLGSTDARPDAQGDGYVVYVGLDEYLYRKATTE